MQSQNTPKPRKIQARSVYSAIRRAYPSMVACARSLGIPRNTLYLVVLGKVTSRRIADQIAALYGRPAWEIWPGLYEAPAPENHEPAA